MKYTPAKSAKRNVRLRRFALTVWVRAKLPQWKPYMQANHILRLSVPKNATVRLGTRTTGTTNNAMKKIDLFRKKYEVWGFDLYKEIVIIFAFTPRPTEQYATFGFLWTAEVNGEQYGDWTRTSSEKTTPSDTEKTEMFELLQDQARRTIDEILSGKVAVPTLK